jgi:hypothetical protein
MTTATELGTIQVGTSQATNDLALVRYRTERPRGRLVAPPSVEASLLHIPN